MKHQITVDGQERQIDIRPMDEDFIVYRKMYVPPLTRENIGRVNPGDADYLAKQFKDGRFQIIEAFFRKQVRIVGSCMLLAWDGDGVIGKMHFTTREMHEAMGSCVEYGGCYCVEHDDFPHRIQSFGDEELERLLRCESRTLRVLCFNIGHFDERYQGQGIATDMLEYLKQWAREQNWRRIEIHSCPDITPTTVIGDWMLRRGPLERRGFRVIEETQAPAEQSKARLRVIEDLAAGKKDMPDWADWYVHNFQRLYADPSWWSEYDKDYLMACDLCSWELPSR